MQLQDLQPGLGCLEFDLLLEEDPVNRDLARRLHIDHLHQLHPVALEAGKLDLRTAAVSAGCTLHALPRGALLARVAMGRHDKHGLIHVVAGS